MVMHAADLQVRQKAQKEMIDRLKVDLDCRDVVARDLGAARQRGAYRQYKCPFHDDSSPSLTVWAVGWKCYGCGRSGDVIAWVQAYHNLYLSKALEYLNGAAVELPKREQSPATAKELAPPPKEWQAAANDVANYAFDQLWGPGGKGARRYLTEQRGLDETTISGAMLGYVPGAPDEWRTVAGMHVPAGIVIPWLVEGELWQVKVRRAAGKPKYLGVTGGVAAGLYGVDEIDPRGIVMIVEGEIDALSVNQERVGIRAVALGMAVKQFDSHWMQKLLFAERIYARLDRNAAGVAGVARLLEISRRVMPVQVDEPYDDCNDFAVRDRQGFRAWLKGLL
ncbi:MAG: CHC2 zinc finger domain-containing protein [Anaerolineae bacterium]|nr:CHC2 zinc finger domain-containing protein [Anaerolineae bacterium]NUQ06369.1 toprim domain-containing protein [Anaerolineae bacterium]